MDIERAKELLPIIQAFAECKKMNLVEKLRNSYEKILYWKYYS